MKTVYTTIAAILLLALLGGCNNENPMDKEQYIKQIYLVGAYDHVFKQTVKYNDTEVQETFVSVAGSGSLGLDQDVKVRLQVVPEEVMKYNLRYIGYYGGQPFYSPLPEEAYNIPSLETTLRKNGEIFERIPVLVDTRQIHCDSNYAISFRIASVSGYQTTKDSILLLSFDMQNDYSATYALSGTMHRLDATGHAIDTTRTGKNKVLKAVSQYEVRMFHYDSAEKDEDVAPHGQVIRINPADNSVSLRPWDAEHYAHPAITSSGGNYNAESKTFYIWYTYTADDGTPYMITETLENR